jgi:ABC-type transport system substrate-binding protein
MICRKKMLAIVLTSAFLFMAVSPLLGEAVAVPGGLKNGPYIDKLVFRVMTGEDQQVLSLLNDEIDIIDQQLDPVFLPQFEGVDYIDVENVQRNGYGYLTINCAKYPFNITAFRRAIAFAMDKERISDDIWEGLASPLDSCVPAVNPFSIEGQLPYTYYEADTVTANALLNAAGFLDDDEDGVREAPDGSDFDVTIECSQDSNIALQCGQVMAECLVGIGIDAEAIPTDFYEYLNRLYFHGDYDIVFLGSGFNNFDVDWLAYEFWSEYADEPYWNFPNFRNSSYDSWRDQLLHATSYDEVYEAAIEMQRIWVYECPMVICYENLLLSAYRVDDFEGFVNSPIDGVPGFWTNYKVHKIDGTQGGTYRWCNSEDIDTFNFMATSSAYSQNILNMLYDSLVTIGPDGHDVPWLAESWVIETHADNPAVPDGHTRITFNIIENATWSDGTPLTALDVAYTLNFYQAAPGNQYGSDLDDLTAAYAPTTYTAVVEFATESYWHLHVVGYKPIIPAHVFTNIGADNWQTWNPDPTEDYVTSGPFNVSEYVQGEFVELTRNPNWFYAPQWPTTSTSTTTTTTTTTDFTLALVAGAVGAAVVILVGAYVVMKRR